MLVSAPNSLARRAHRLRRRGCAAATAASPSSSSPCRCRCWSTLGLVGLETANLAMAHLRVSNIAMLTADNAARVRDSIDEANVDRAADRRQDDRRQHPVPPERPDHPVEHRAQHGRRRAAPAPASGSAGSAATAAGTSSRATARRAPARPTPSLQAVGPAGNQISASAGTAVMVVEVDYDYQPLVSDAIFGPRIIRYESAFNVRQRDQPGAEERRQPATPAQTCTSSTPDRRVRRLKPAPLAPRLGG